MRTGGLRPPHTPCPGARWVWPQRPSDRRFADHPIRTFTLLQFVGVFLPFVTTSDYFVSFLFWATLSF